MPGAIHSPEIVGHRAHHQTVGQFVYVIRKRISLPADKAIFLFVNNTIAPTQALMSTVYEQHRDPDGFMCASPPTTRSRPNSLVRVRCSAALTGSPHPH